MSQLETTSTLHLTAEPVEQTRRTSSVADDSSLTSSIKTQIRDKATHRSENMERLHQKQKDHLSIWYMSYFVTPSMLHLTAEAC